MTASFGLHAVLRASFRIWTRNFVSFITLAAVIHSPVIIAGIVILAGEGGPASLKRMMQLGEISVFAVPLLNILLSAVVAGALGKRPQGQRLSLEACIAGFHRFLPALATTMLVSLCITAALLCVGFPLAFVGGVVGPIVGVLAALFAYAMLSMGPQASVIESLGALGALRRSLALTHGHRFAIAVLLALPPVLAHGLVLVLIPTASSPYSVISLDFLARSVLGGSVSATIASVAYYQLRAAKEGAGTDLAAILD